MLVTSRHAQDFWLHEIKKDESPEVRYSFTLRDVSPHFINSTIILGDSNTRLIKRNPRYMDAWETHQSGPH